MSMSMSMSLPIPVSMVAVQLVVSTGPAPRLAPDVSSRPA
jgi:hypothetical protein